MPQFGPEGESCWLALIGDVVSSKDIAVERREGFQRDLEGLLETLNDEAPAGSIAARLAITAGDEFQGLFREPGAVVSVIATITDRLHPVEFLFGIGWGTLSTRLRPEAVSKNDGLCFHRAREALERRSGRRGKGTRWVSASGFGESVDETIEALFGLMHAVRSRWTPKQRLYSGEARWMSQKEVARKFGVGPSTVNESLGAASFGAVLDGEEALRGLLRRFGSQAEFGPDSVRKAD